MIQTGYLAVFLVGLLGGTHCVSMCGGIVGALTAQRPGEKQRNWLIHLAYNLGRILTYTLMGALLGALGTAGLLFANVLPIQLGLYILANIMLVLLGLYLTGFTTLLMPLERLGHHIWRYIQPFTRRFLPASSPQKAFPLGMLWGFLPCGMVYSVLTTALVTGSATHGAALMLAFGLGTLPNLLLAGMLLQRFRGFTRKTVVRLVAGLVVLGFGVLGLWRAPELGDALWRGAICVV